MKIREPSETTILLGPPEHIVDIVLAADIIIELRGSPTPAPAAEALPYDEDDFAHLILGDNDDVDMGDDGSGEAAEGPVAAQLRDYPNVSKMVESALRSAPFGGSQFLTDLLSYLKFGDPSAEDAERQLAAFVSSRAAGAFSEHYWPGDVWS